MELNPATRLVSFGHSLSYHTQLLWNDSPVFLSWLQEHDLPAISGKGLNLWSGLGFALSQTELQALIIHDCDIKNYTPALPVSLAIPVANLEYQFCKGFYSPGTRAALWSSYPALCDSAGAIIGTHARASAIARLHRIRFVIRWPANAHFQPASPPV